MGQRNVEALARAPGDLPSPFTIDTYAQQLIDELAAYESAEMLVFPYSDRVAASVWTMRRLCDLGAAATAAFAAIAERRRENAAKREERDG